MRRDFCETPTSLPIGCAASWRSRAPTSQRRGERRRSRCRVVSLAFEITPWHRRRPEADQSARLTAPQRRRKLTIRVACGTLGQVCASGSTLAPFRAGANPVKILVIDDSATMRRIIKSHLATMGFDAIVEARDGESALAQLASAAIDLVITDSAMATMSGPDLVL